MEVCVVIIELFTNKEYMQRFVLIYVTGCKI